MQLKSDGMKREPNLKSTRVETRMQIICSTAYNIQKPQNNKWLNNSATMRNEIDEKQ